MELVERLEKMAKDMIEAHYEFGFKKMSELMDQSVIAKEDTFFKEDKFTQVCETLKENCGKMVLIENIGILNKVDSLQTLCKEKHAT